MPMPEVHRKQEVMIYSLTSQMAPSRLNPPLVYSYSGGLNPLLLTYHWWIQQVVGLIHQVVA